MGAAQFTTVLIQSVLAMAAVGLALGQGVSVGSEPPKLHGQTLDGKVIVLPDAAAGKVALLLLGTSRKGGERTGPWKDHFVTDFGSNQNACYYVAALLQSAPAPIRGLIRSGMRAGTPVAAQAHVLTSASDDEAWKKYMNIRDNTLPCVLLLDESGHARWSYTGSFDSNRYEDLKKAASALLSGR
jgi:hypothetical protein